MVTQNNVAVLEAAQAATTTHGNITVESIIVLRDDAQETLWAAARAARLALTKAFAAFRAEAWKEKGVAPRELPSFLAQGREAPAGCESIARSPWQRWAEAYCSLMGPVLDRAYEIAHAKGDASLLAYLPTPESVAEFMSRGPVEDEKAAAIDAALVAAMPARFRQHHEEGKAAAKAHSRERAKADAKTARAEIEAYCASVMGNSQIDLLPHEAALLVEAYIQRLNEGLEGKDEEVKLDTGETVTRRKAGTLARGFYLSWDAQVAEERAGAMYLVFSVLKDAELELAGLRAASEG